MPNAIGRVFALLAAFVLLSCSTSVPLGVWAYEDERGYVGVSLEGEGRCRVVEVAKGGPGLGSECRYKVEGSTVIVFPMQPGATELFDDIVTLDLTYQVADDTMVLTRDSRIVLTRVPELITR